MWSIRIWGLEFFDIFYNFFIYCFLGWIYESTYVSIKSRKWVNRGFLNGPVIPIYGCAATLLYLAFFNDAMIDLTMSRTAVSILIIFFSGMILASLLEFVTSWLMEKLFHARWWDYSNIPLNLQGRICLPVSLFWGLLSVVMAEWIQPLMDQVVSQIPRRAGELAGYVIAVVFCSDIAVTVAAALQLDRKLADMQRLREEFAASMERLKLFESREELREKLADSPFYTYFGNKKIEFEQNVEKWLEKYKLLAEKREEESSRIRTELKSRAEELRAAYRKQRSSRLNQMIYRRIFRAFPHMKATRGQEILEAWKERIRKRKK